MKPWLWLQINAVVLCSDGSSAPAPIAVNAVSVALMRARVPWQGPLAAVQVLQQAGRGQKDTFVVQPSAEQLEQCNTSGVFVATADAVLLADFQVSCDSRRCAGRMK